MFEHLIMNDFCNQTPPLHLNASENTHFKFTFLFLNANVCTSGVKQ